MMGETDVAAYLKTRRLIVGLLAIILLSAATGGAAFLPIPDIPAETVSGYRASGDYGWGYGFDIGFENRELNVSLRIGLAGYDPGPGLVAVWENTIENTWDRGFEIIDDSFRYPFNLNVIFVTDGSQRVHHTVTVVGGQGRSNMLRWYSASFGDTAAHEAGHMLGLYDEYFEGAQNTAVAIIDIGSIMGSVDGIARTRHYEPFVGWLGKRAVGRELSIGNGRQYMVVPEPHYVFLLGFGMVALRIRKRNNRKG